MIIPAYNEEARIRSVLTAFTRAFSGHEIIVVCDGPDRTAEIVGEVSKENPEVRLLRYPERLGKGGAIIEGFRASHGQRIGFADADESAEPAEIKGMFDALDGADGLIGSRRLKGSKITIKQPLMRRAISRIFNIVFAHILFGLPFRDTQCGAKVFTREAVMDIVDDLQGRGFETDLEILWRLQKKGYQVREYPITWKHSEGSTFRLSYSWKMFVSLMKIRWG
ncbi:glycosyltransferase [uncultured Methanofollis sp.]|uniref:glycosyltransferase n=1 Tax=uncultured Methanofollis sp. TaxID=262500 RepID=UPI00261BFD34|nr:glycosyltransferase [uncultured Methanofollis sp.]